MFLYTDDQAQWAVGAYGNREIKTPHLDRLAQRGAIFRNAFTVTPVCSPSRAALMTSRYPSELGIADWIDPRKEPDIGLAPSAITWPELLKGFGYATMLAGKWHLGTRDEFHPTRQGFDRFFGFRDGSNQPIDPRLEVDGQVRQLKGSLPDLLVDEGLKFIERHRERPFLLSIHFRAPHTPYGPVPEEDSAPYRTLDPTIPDVPGLPRERVKQLYREYYASVSSVDRNVGRLLAKLDEWGLTERTVVIFTSDHGYMIGQQGSGTKATPPGWLKERRGIAPTCSTTRSACRSSCAGPGSSRPERPSHESSRTSTCCRRSSRSQGWVRRAISRSEERASSRSCEARRPSPGTTRSSANTTCTITRSPGCE